MAKRTNWKATAEQLGKELVVALRNAEVMERSAANQGDRAGQAEASVERLLLAAERSERNRVSTVQTLQRAAAVATRLRRQCQNQEATIQGLMEDSGLGDRLRTAAVIATGLLANPDLIWPPTPESRAALAREALATADALIAAAKEAKKP
jgi:hypothetical protein